MSKTFDNNKPDYDYAVLVGVGDPLDELEALCATCNILTVAKVTQKIKEIDVAYYIGKGKVDEIAAMLGRGGTSADSLVPAPTVVVFDVELSGSKVRNLEQAFGVPVIDRSKVILDIFAQRAQSAEGKLQVELAQLKYHLPRLRNASVNLFGKINRDTMAQMKNAVGMRGPGEKKLELDKRKIRDEITDLEHRLAKLKQNRSLNKQKSQKSGKPRVCLVGYTNSGKSTLLNTIAKSDALAEDKLFATLDPKTANVYIDLYGACVLQKSRGSETCERSEASGGSDQRVAAKDMSDTAQQDCAEKVFERSVRHGEPRSGNFAAESATGGIYGGGIQILLTDTVGFINKLPHEFINAFESTLDEARYADLLLHVADISNPDWRHQVQVVNEVLEKIGAAHVPVIMVYNKVDKNPYHNIKDGILISAKNNTGIDLLKQQIAKLLTE